MGVKKSKGASSSKKKRSTGGAKRSRGSSRSGASKKNLRGAPTHSREGSDLSISSAVGEEAAERLEALQDQMGDLQGSLMLTRVRNEIEEIETALAMLPSEIEELRARGYVFRGFLENKVGVLGEQWDEVYDRVSREIDRQLRELEREASRADIALRQAAGGDVGQLTHAESAIETLEEQVRAAESAATGLYSTLGGNVNQTRSQVGEIRWLLDELDEASFDLYSGEDPVAACKAELADEREEAKGVLYLTDERLIFERKEEVATKKVLFITTEKELVQELFFEVPIGQVERAQASQKGLLGGKEMLELTFAPEADLSEVTLRLRGADNEEWAGLVGRVRSGDIARERIESEEEEEVEVEAAAEEEREVPTKCPTCGATFTTPVTRGVREIQCEYCGTVVRV